MDYQFTADMENGLDQIAHGKETGREWLTAFYFGTGRDAAHTAHDVHEGLQQQVAPLVARLGLPSASRCAQSSRYGP